MKFNYAFWLAIVAIKFATCQEDLYRPTQHFVFPIVEINNEATKPESSIVQRGDKHQYIFNYAYSACFDTEYNLPLWVSHHLNQSLLNKVYKENISRYPADAQYNNLKGSALSSSGYDHGHLAPAADFQWSKFSYLQSYLMTNISPQHGCFNQKGWCHLEGTVRKWVEENDKLELYIVSGALIDTIIDTLCLAGNIEVHVPKYFYKVVLGMEPGKKPFAIGYLVPNHDIPTYDVQPYEMTVREIEDLTRLDFFSFLPRKMQDEVETEIPSVTYYSTRISCPDKECESVYRNRVTPENRTKLKCE
jgi:endonuclease G, mitochondrial